MPFLVPNAHRSLRWGTIGLATIAAACTLTACDGGGTPAADQVASLARSSVPAGSASGGTAAAAAPDGSSSAANTSGRPQERIDDTAERRTALIAAWDACLIAHGARSAPGGVTTPGAAPTARTLVEPLPPAAISACLNKEPLGPPQLDPAQNPNYRDDWVANVACLRAHGMPVHLTSDTSDSPNGLSWGFDSATAPLPANQSQIETDCEQQAFGDKEK